MLLFAFSVFTISLSGVLMPGPVTAVTIAKGYESGLAGALVGLGHVIVELPLMVLTYLGLSRYLVMPRAKGLVSLAGGAMLVFMGISLLGLAGASYYEKSLSYHPVVAGIATTAANPYFYLWWATVGAALVLKAQAFGRGGMFIFAGVHSLCDVGWLLLISLVVFKSRQLGMEEVWRVVFSLCALLLAGFGAWFIVAGVRCIRREVLAKAASTPQGGV
ncbi:MAG: LysE family transporter [Chloroflexota bacterium]